MRIALGLAVLGLLAASPPPGPHTPTSPESPATPCAAPAPGEPAPVCGAAAPVAQETPTGLVSSLTGPAAHPALPTPLWFDQNPRLLRADHAGGLSLDNFLVVGDVAALTFERPALSAAAAGFIVRETWRRTGTTDIDGHLVSVFNPGWNAAALWDSIGWQRRGFDRPWVQFGTLLVPRPSGEAGADGGDVERFFIRLRVAPLNLPPAQVTRIDAQTQYASHVVNIVMPRFGDRRLSDGDYGHALDEAAKRFYAHFRDEYASIAFVPRQPHVAPYDAFHHNVRNPIAGLGLPVFDDSEAYGSAGALRSVEFYPDVSFTSNAASTRAISHQWIDYWDWSALAGSVDPAGRAAGPGTPLLYPGEVYAGAVLDVTRRVAALGGGTGYAIERTPAPARLHPTTRYRMGLIGPGAVPEILLFENQGQFDETGAAAPAAGTAVVGGARRVHINDVLAEHGARSGPVDDAWSRVTVVMSRDGLLSAEEMSYWNFFAARHAATAGTTTWEGVPSFFEAAGGAATLRTDVTPLRTAKIAETFETGHMPIAPGEFRDVRLDAPVPARFTVGETVTVAGTVTTLERDDFHIACVDWTHAGAIPDLRACGAVIGDRFSIGYRFTAGDAGHRALVLYLFYPGSGLQLPRASISGITVVGPSNP